MKEESLNTQPTSSHLMRRVAALLSLLAAGVAGYLTFVSVIQGGMPPGCGSGSGCASVLGSAWSRVLTVPVALPACGIYLLFAGMLFLKKSLVFWEHLLAGSILGGVLWFVAVQLFILKAICPWCMADHVLGGSAALLVLISGEKSIKGLALGVLLPLFMVAVQLLQPGKVYTLSLPEGQNADQQVEGRRLVSLLEGRFVFDVVEEPHFGNPAAERLVLLAVDYACPHCRNLHAMALEKLAEHPDDFCVVVLPTPINPSCNPVMKEVPGRFKDSCELARLSLQVYQSNPTAWTAFDRWLFASELPPAFAEADAKAAELLEGLDKASRARAEESFQRNIDLFAAMPVENENARRVPVTWWIHHPPVVGPFDDADLLWENAAAPPLSETETP